MNQELREELKCLEISLLLEDRIKILSELIPICQFDTSNDDLDLISDYLETFNDFYDTGCGDESETQVEYLLHSACWVALASNENISRKLYVSILQSVAFSDDDQPELRDAIEYNPVGDSF